MKKLFAMMLAALFIGALATACEDDESACDELTSKTEKVMKDLCKEFSDCFMCEEGDNTGEGEGEGDVTGEEPSEDQCQATLDSFDQYKTQMRSSFEAACSMDF